MGKGRGAIHKRDRVEPDKTVCGLDEVTKTRSLYGISIKKLFIVEEMEDVDCQNCIRMWRSGKKS